MEHGVVAGDEAGEGVGYGVTDVWIGVTQRAVEIDDDGAQQRL